MLSAHRRAAAGEAREQSRPLRRPRQYLGLHLGRVLRHNLGRTSLVRAVVGTLHVVARAVVGTLHVVARAVTRRVVLSSGERPKLAQRRPERHPKEGRLRSGAQQFVHRARLQRPRRVTKRRVAAPIARVDVGTMLQQQPERASVT
jgi:hypothetical protein